MTTASANSPVQPKLARRRKDLRGLALAVIVLGILGFGFVIKQLPLGKNVKIIEEPVPEHPEMAPMDRAAVDLTVLIDPNPAEPLLDPRENPAGHEAQARAMEIRTRFNQAVAMLHAEQFDEAIIALHRLLQLAPEMPEGYVNMGYAYLGKQEYQLARDFFMSAIDLNPAQANAHYGIAMAYEGLGDLESALGGMRGFLHLTNNPDPDQLHVARARSALWEWESKLGRGPWGPTKGIPPGLTAEQIRRDGRGMGTMMPIPGTEREDGTTRFEIKHSDKIPGMFKP